MDTWSAPPIANAPHREWADYYCSSGLKLTAVQPETKKAYLPDWRNQTIGSVFWLAQQNGQPLLFSVRPISLAYLPWWRQARPKSALVVLSEQRYVHKGGPRPRSLADLNARTAPYAGVYPTPGTGFAIPLV